MKGGITKYTAKHGANVLGYVEYDSAACILKFINHGKSIPRKALALGGTGKTDNKDAAGQFGEG